MKNYHAPFTYECFYHIYNQGNNKENLFSNDGNYLFFLQQLVKYLLPYLKFYTYCLMPNHFHLLVQVREKEEIMRIFTKLSKVSKVNFNINITIFFDIDFRRRIFRKGLPEIVLPGN